MSSANQKTFDCVEFKREAQARRYEETRGMSSEEYNDYLRSRIESGPLSDFWKRVQEGASITPNAGRSRPAD